MNSSIIHDYSSMLAHCLFKRKRVLRKVNHRDIKYHIMTLNRICGVPILPYKLTYKVVYLAV